ncbi:MAG: AI-2E family transporter [Candidatus Merdivicinus sp.]|jgi:predicted PurR-regulated permease PerM
MKIEFNRRYNTIAVYTVIVIAIAAAIVVAIVKIDAVSAFFSRILGILSPFIWGFSIAYILCPLMNTFEEGLHRFSRGKINGKGARGLALLLAYLTAVLALVLFFSIIIPQIVQSITSLAAQSKIWLEQLQVWATDLAEEYHLQRLPEDTVDRIISAAEGWLQTFTANLTTLVPQIFHVTMSFTTGVVNIILGAIIAIYLLLDKERFFAHIRKLFCAFFSKNKVDRLTAITRKSHQVFSGFIIGKLLDSFIIFLLCLFFMTVFRWPYAMLISVIVGVTNVIPYFGPFFGAIPSILILLIVDPITALWFSLFILALQQLDGNVIGPKILGDSTGLSPFWVIFSITVFGSLLGPVGMFIGVPLFAVIYHLISEFTSGKLEQKQLPVDTRCYAPPDHPILEKKPKRKWLSRFHFQKKE